MRETNGTGTAGAVNRATGLPGLVGLGLLGLAWLGSGTALAAFPGHNGQIAFQSHRHAPPEIYAINADGGCPTRLTDNPTFDGSPAWSADGRRIAFVSNRDGIGEIYVMNADGSDETRLTYSPSHDGGPAWSPDGRRIAFRSDRDGHPEVYVMNANGSNPRRLTHNPGFDGAPTWSPDGGRIAFASVRSRSPLPGPGGDDLQVYVMNADGSNQTLLTRPSAPGGRPGLVPGRAEDRLRQPARGQLRHLLDEPRRHQPDAPD